ncbi:MAG: pyridoxamine 5'-phosphate oxidase family protein [Actinobacteria bacterium HGW-Actinobacteria-2]|nr:MAG: pyridoxamine 5'-phosphate oxidase family protein [Actinobacteria bacterium HGW-Actinobacteria-2]
MKRTLVPSRKGERGRTDRAALDELLDDVLVGYMGLSLDEGPLVIPVSFARQGDRILFHGSTGSRRMRTVAEGAQICFTVTAIDALKISRSLEGTGLAYRSAVLFGNCTLLEGAEKSQALNDYVDRYVPGRTGEVRGSTAKEEAATMVLALAIDQWSMKVSPNPPQDGDEDLLGDAWAGMLPLRTGYTEAVAAPDVRPGIAVPASVERLLAR